MKYVYEYRDYRKFLKDYYELQKQTVRGYTYARFAAIAELSSPNYLKLVIDGSRNLTTANIQAFAKAMNIQGQELEYFEALVLENQAETPREKSYYARRLRLLKKNSPHQHHVARKSPTNQLPKTMRTALRLCSDGKTWKEAIRIGVEELCLTPEKAEESLRTLVESGELYRNSKDLLSLKTKHTMMSDPKALSQAQMIFLKDGLDEASQVFSERYSKGAAKFLSLLFTAEPDSLPHIFSDLREAFEAAANKYDPSPEQERGVYRAQFQVYRLKKDAP